MMKSKIADALESSDWSGVSIGNKVLIAAAITELRKINTSTNEALTLDGKTTIREYVANTVPDDQISDEWTKGYEECKRRIHNMFEQPAHIDCAALNPV